jgi:putative transposase
MGRRANMSRIARVVVPGIPHHIMQRGNRRQLVFFSDDDRKTYLEYLRIYAKPAGIRFWGYCLMDNHVHIIAIPDREESLARGFSEAHRRYTRRVNFRENWRGYLWEGRFKSCPLSEPHLYAAMRYIERNPVRAKIVRNAWEYPWSSAKVHVFSQKDSLLDENFVISEVKDWRRFLLVEEEETVVSLFRLHLNTGRPLGDSQFIEATEEFTGRILHKQKPGPKRKDRIIK